ncbi:MAG: hypothetical protein L6R42_000281 [Xanthoria sp. 1 TBL-2021]|nr:MAG: hypothetical protein L6R42_000281 [Xanthoria sp. 1 TBL-2021]
MTTAYNPTKNPPTVHEIGLTVIAMQCLTENLSIVSLPLPFTLAAQSSRTSQGNIKIKDFTLMADFKNKNSARAALNRLLRKINASTVDNFYVAYSTGSVHGNKKSAVKIDEEEAEAVNGPKVVKQEGEEKFPEAAIEGGDDSMVV